MIDTGVKMKADNVEKFFDLIRNQFNHGGDKYSLTGRTDKEVTDVACEMSPGKTGVDWIMGTIVKYCGRFVNFQREKDLLKIATYCYIAWLKCEYHLNAVHDEDVTSEGKSFEDFIDETDNPDNAEFENHGDIIRNKILKYNNDEQMPIFVLKDSPDQEKAVEAQGITSGKQPLTVS